jgi:peptidoglycan/LPS O-acetylase OafA/YrhL
VWVGRGSGGVDVFFVLSGFLIVGLLVRTLERDEAVDLGRTWTRLFWRLAPTAAVVLLASSVAAAIVLPASRWAQNLREVVASTFFVENWRLAFDAVDYYADNGAASVVQHFWSLSIQAQFYLLAPMLVLAVAELARARGVDVRQALLAALGATAVASFVYSVIATAFDQPFAYFDSRTRAWEFAVGGILALVLERLSPSPRARLALGWTGLVGLVMCGAVLDVGAGFPGYLALWPVLAAVAIIVAGQVGAPTVS